MPTTASVQSAKRGRRVRKHANEPRYPIESVDNALSLLMWLHRRSSVTVAQAAEYLNVARSTAHRLLAMLQHHGLVQQEPILKSYMLGPALFEVGLAAIREIDIQARVKPNLERLVAEVGETAHLVVRKGTSVIFLDSVQSDKAVRAGSRTGHILPAHCCASGKALLATLDDQTLADLYPAPTLPALTSRSLTSRAQLFDQLADVRKRGYALNRGESEDGLTAAAAAIRDSRGQPIGAVTVAGPSFRMNGKILETVIKGVLRCASEAAVSPQEQVRPTS